MLQRTFLKGEVRDPMNITRKKMCYGFVLLLCMGISIALSAQTTDAAPQSDAGKSAAANASSASDAQSQNTARNSTYVIGANDMLAINVWKEPDVSRIIPVRSDGKISLPLAGEIQASGKTPVQLEQEITEKLKTYISDPEVTVMVQESKSQKFNILGQVAKPGTYPLTSTTTVLDAIALAGGFKDFAKKKSIYVLRKKTSGEPERMPFNYKDVISGKNPSQNIPLQSEDTIIVP
jgi:polysaccharide biosynthesis/export protein